MNKQLNANQLTYTPQMFKNFESALCAFFENECPQIGGVRTRQVLVCSIQEMVRKYYPETSHLGPGQTVWPTVHKDAKGAYGKKIQNTEMTSVILDLVQSCDASDRAGGKKLRDVKIEATARLCRQAYEQNGCLTNAELAILLKIAPTTVSKYIAEWEQEKKIVLPRRGTIHDMGPTLTHKKIIIHKLFIERKTYQQTSRETNHSLPAIARYITAFRQTLLCRQKNMNTEEIAYAAKMTTRLVRQYEAIIDYYAENSYVLEQFLKSKPRFESNPEKWANDYALEV